MIQLFLRQYLRLIIFLVGLQLIVNFILSIDKGFQDVALMYLNTVWIVLEVLFFIWCYWIDRRKMKTYSEQTGNYVEAIEEEFKRQLAGQQVQLQQQKMLLLERQDELLAWVHEMKSPMTAMQLLIDKSSAYELKERLENEWLRLYLLLDQQLHATRIMTIEQDNRIEKVQLKPIIIEEIKALRSWCFEKQIEIDLQNLQQEVLTDAKWLGFIIRQILSNAVKYSPAGGKVIIYCEMNNDQLVLAIEDKGVGIKKEDLPRVFRKSYTGTIGRETSAATGMGLYLAKQAADSLHLKLEIESIEQHGTTVCVLFPKKDAYNETLAM